MKFTKIFTDNLDHCYAVMRLKAQGRDFLVVASEEDAPCYAYDLDDNFKKQLVWEDVGGTMTLVQIPGTLDFLATQRFYPGFNAKTCRIVKETWTGAGWRQTVLGDFPYVHRFDLLPKDDGQGYWYVGCSIANSKQGEDDWSDPGKIWVGEYDPKTEKITKEALDLALQKNHGYKRMDGHSLITGVQGLFKLTWPTKAESWQLEQLLDHEISEIVSADLNGDGKEEYLMVEGFHGPDLRLTTSDFKTVTKKAGQTPFGHALWGGKLGQNEYFIFGWRQGERDLVLITAEDLSFQVIQQDVGPSNILVYAKDDKQYLLSANREVNEVAVYLIEPAE